MAGAIGSGGVIDSLFVALGFRTDTSGLKSFQRDAEEAKSSVLSIGTALAAFATGFAVKEIAKIGSDFEQTKIQIAGFFTALGQSKDFNSALGDADDALQMIAAAAAKLPGEAEEYQQVFTDTFSFVKGAVGGSIQEMTDFTNTLTAIGKAGRLDAGQIARETDELLAAGEGRAMTRNRLWMQMMPLLRQVDGQAKITTKSFNALTEQKRAELMKKAFSGLKPMLDASAASFDAMWGAMVSGAKKLVRLGTVGLFEKMKRAISQLNDVFFDADFNLTKFGQEVVDGGKKIVQMIGNVVDFGVAVAKWFGGSEMAAKSFKLVLGVLGMALGALAFEKVARGVGLLFKGLFDLKRLLMGGVFLAIFLVAEDLYVFEKGGKSVTGMLVNKLGPAGEYITKTVLGGMILGLAALRFAFVRTAIRAVASWVMMLGPLAVAILAIGAFALGIYEVYKHWDEFGAGAKTAITVATTALGFLLGAILYVKAQALLAAGRIFLAWLVAQAPLIPFIALLALVAVAAYELGNNWGDVMKGMSDAWDAFIDSYKEDVNFITETLTLGQWSPFDTKEKKTGREIKDLDASTAYYKKKRHENNPDQMSEGPKADTSNSSRPLPPNRNAHSEDFNVYQSDAGATPETPDQIASFTTAESADYDRRRKAQNDAFAAAVKAGYATPTSKPGDGVGATGAPGTGDAAAPTGLGAARELLERARKEWNDRTSMGGAAASGAGNGPVNNSITTINIPAINVNGAQHPEETAREVMRQFKRELERRDRSVTRDAQNKKASKG